jgi:general stress protein CsbA
VKEKWDLIYDFSGENMTALKFGLALPYGSARMAAKLSCLAEEAGWDGCFLGDAIWCEDPMIALAAAAMTTHRIRLGTMIVPMPLRRPWKVASESVALDHLSDGRLILGLGAGAVWMGWQGFPDEVTDAKTRAEMLDESIDILTLLYQRKQFDYDGKHYQLKLTLVDEMHYPPKPVQQPRIPLWVPGIWPRKKSMQRVLKCDGVLAGAGIAEETTYRLVCMSLFWRLTRRPWVAIVLSALLFGAYYLSPLDALYHQYWERPLTVFTMSTIMGVVMGYVYLKRGYESAVLGHTLGDWIPMLLSRAV